MTMSTGLNVISLQTFIAGFVIWNIIALLAVWLFATLYNNFKE